MAFGELEDLLGGLEDQGWCLTCGMYGHMVAICPFQEEEPDQERKAGRRSRMRRGRAEGEYLLVPPPPPWKGLLLPCLAPPKDACLAPPKYACHGAACCSASPGAACCAAPVTGYEGEVELPLPPPWPGAPLPRVRCCCRRLPRGRYQSCSVVGNTLAGAP
ncbi:UNVERIFIED_CONTAM: hypothetical protein FKN15_029604 [Acipenser sinensis]